MHFKNINSVRAIAASMVMVHHIEQSRAIIGLYNSYSEPAVVLSGKLGVMIFFALSGFLITSLLLIEQQQMGQIKLRDFYIRRALRIWPLYFLVVLLSFFVWPYVSGMQLPDWVNPQDKLALNLLLDTFLLANYQLYFVGPISFNAQIWSVGVEEQFYVFWPLVVGLARRVPLSRLVLGLLGFFIFLKLLPIMLPATAPYMGQAVSLSQFLTDYSQFDCMMWGAFFAALHATGVGRTWLTSRIVQVLGYGLFVVLAAAGVRLGGGILGSLHWDMYALLAALLLYNMVQPTSILNLEYRWLSRLGTWSYGMYMLHMLVVWPLAKLTGENVWILYPAVFASTIALAAASYYCFEKPFLRIKERFAVVKTSAEAVPA